jgi:thiamine-phosphate pyrophosphorylase
MPDRTSIARIIDANFNRAREGIRVLEEVARFILDDPSRSEKLKGIRHALVESVTGFGLTRQELLDARDSESDVGRKIQGQLESDRKNIDDIIASNFSRVTEALRAIEEFGKLIDSKSAEKIKDLRYEVYTLEKNFISPD